MERYAHQYGVTRKLTASSSRDDWEVDEEEGLSSLELPEELCEARRRERGGCAAMGQDARSVRPSQSAAREVLC